MKTALRNYWKYRYLTLMLVPIVIYYLIFCYYPIYGLLIAFKDFRFKLGILGSPWNNFQSFTDLFHLANFWKVFRNTFIISAYKLVFGFPAPILLAMLLNEVKNVRFKKIIQTVSYMPYFLSWVVLAGIFMQLLSPSTGPVNQLLQWFGIKPIYFLADSVWFRPTLVITSIWKNIGWGTIVYLAAIAGINQELYEAAIIDGANRVQRARYITIPSMVPVITLMLIFAVGSIIGDDFDQIFNLFNESVYEVADVISTYTYRVGLVDMQYSYGTAVGLFTSVISLVLMMAANFAARRYSDYTIF